MFALSPSRTAIVAFGLLVSLSHLAAAQELPRHEIPKAEAQADAGTVSVADPDEERKAQDALADWQARQHERHARASEQQALAGGATAGDVSAQSVTSVLTLLSVRFFSDHAGNTVIIGEVQNSTETTLSFAQAKFSLFNAGETLLGSASSYVLGSQNARLANTGGFSSVLPPGAIGFFKVWTTVPLLAAAAFSFTSEAETFLTFSPRATMVASGLSLSPNGVGGTDYTFTVRNNGTATTAYFVKALLAGYDGGAINDVNFSYVSGSSTTQCGVTTDTAIRFNESAGIDSSFLRPVTSIGRLAFEWDEVGVSPAIFTGTAAGGSGTTNVFSQCPWTATSNSSWISVTSGGTGTGDGTVSFAVSANNSTLARSGSLTIAGVTVIVNQAAAAVGTFTDAVLTPGVSPVKGVHIIELRARIDTLRGRSGLAAFSWTDANLTAGVTLIKRAHIAELRAALSPVYEAAGRTEPAYTDPTLVAGVTTMKAAHVLELRNAVVAIE